MTTYPDDDDGAILTHLAGLGVDMTQPRLIEFFVNAPGDDASQAILAALKNAGYDASVDFDEGEPDDEGVIDPDDDEFGPSWTVSAKVTMVPEHAELMRIQQDLERLASPLGGEVDGWETAV